MSGIHVHVDTHGLQDRLAVLKDREVKTAIRRAVSKAGTRGRTIARRLAPVGTGPDAGTGRAGISKTSTRGGTTATCTIFLGGPHAHIMKWQDQGTGKRSTRRGANRGTVEPQYFMERAATELEGWLPLITDLEVDAAIARSGL